MGSGAALMGINAGLGVIQSIFGMSQQSKAEKAAKERREAQPDIVNPYANLSISTKTATDLGQQNLRSEATQINALSQAGGRGASFVPQVGRQTALGSQQISGDLDRQQKEVEQLKARGEVYKAQMLERRYEQEMSGYSQQYAAGQQNMFGGLQQVGNTFASGFAEGGILNQGGGGGNSRPAVSSIQGSTSGVQPFQTTGFVNTQPAFNPNGIQTSPVGIQSTGFQPLIIQ